MPELPEVEIVCRNLGQMLPAGQKIRDWLFFRADLRFKIPKKELRQMNGKALLGIRRRAKYILFDFGTHLVVSHLGMTGSWREEKRGWPRRKHDHLAFEAGAGRFFVFEDARRFGFIEVVEAKNFDLRFAELGAEPLAAGTDFAALSRLFKNLKAPIKSALMNQKLVVGVGNIYASEVLFRVRIHPLKKCSSLSLRDYEKIWKETREVLSEAIEKGGSTIENYRSAFGESGSFQKEFFVYGKEGQACVKCHSLIKSKMLAGRNTFWCPGCQKRS